METILFALPFLSYTAYFFAYCMRRDNFIHSAKIVIVSILQKLSSLIENIKNRKHRLLKGRPRE